MVQRLERPPLQSVDLDFIPLVKSYQKTIKMVSTTSLLGDRQLKGGPKEQAGKFACCVLGQDTYRAAPTFM